MVLAKNYETVSTFVEVIQKKPWPLFFWTQCTILKHRQLSIITNGIIKAYTAKTSKMLMQGV